MIGVLNQNIREVTVVGAGISGLLSAYYLDRAGYRVSLIEEQARAGGLIKTTQTENGIAESAAHSLIATPTVVALCRDLGVELVEPRKEANAKYIVRGGRLRRFPLHLNELATTAYHAAFKRSTNANGQTLEAWGQTHLGNPAVEYLLTPFVRGIYGAEPAQLGVNAAYPSLNIPVGKTLLGSLIRKRRQKSGPKESKQRVAPSYGMGDLVAKLESRLDQRLGARFRKAEKIKSLPDAGNLIVTTPAYVAGQILQKQSEYLAKSLKKVIYTPIVSVTAFVDRRAFTRSVEGVGALMPACEKRNCLGILFNSSSFPFRVANQETTASFTVMMGGAQQPGLVKADNSEIERVVQDEMSSLLGIKEPLDLLIHRWPAALPQYGSYLPSIWDIAKKTWCATPGNILFGNYTGQISLRGMIESSARFLEA